MEQRRTVEDNDTKINKEIQACAKQHGPRKMEFCSKVGEFVRTHVVDILKQLPSLATMQAISPPKGDL